MRRTQFFERRKTVDMASFVKQSDIILKDPKRITLQKFKPSATPMRGTVTNTKASLNSLDTSPDNLRKLFLKARDQTIRDLNKTIQPSDKIEYEMLTTQPERDELVMIVNKMGAQMTRMHSNEVICMATQNGKTSFDFEKMIHSLCGIIPLLRCFGPEGDNFSKRTKRSTVDDQLYLASVDMKNRSQSVSRTQGQYATQMRGTTYGRMMGPPSRFASNSQMHRTANATFINRTQSDWQDNSQKQVDMLKSPQLLQTVQVGQFPKFEGEDHGSILNQSNFQTVNGNLAKHLQQEVDMELRRNIKHAVSELRQDPRVIQQVKQEIANYNAERKDQGAFVGSQTMRIARSNIRGKKLKEEKDREEFLNSVFNYCPSANKATQVQKLLQPKVYEEPQNYHIISKIDTDKKQRRLFNLMKTIR